MMQVASFPSYIVVTIDLSRKFWSAENFGLGDQNFWNIGPPQTEIFENFGPIVEKWSTHLSLKCTVSCCLKVANRSIKRCPDNA